MEQVLSEDECHETMRLGAKLPQAKGLVFDCDGTLLDTMPIYWLSWERTCSELGLNMTKERMYEFAGVPVDRIFQLLIEEQFGEEEKQQKQETKNGDGGKERPTVEDCVQLKRKHHHHIEHVEGQLAGPIDVVVNVVKEYHSKGVPMAVASSGWRDHVMTGLERNGLLQYFETIVTADQVENPKPHPDMFLEAARRLGVEPSHCVGFEDADMGMKAIHAAEFMYACDVRLFKDYPSR